MYAIYCAGEQGRTVLDILRAAKKPEDVVFIDDDESLHGKRIDGVPVVGGSERLTTYEEPVQCLVAFGDKQGVRLRLAQSISSIDVGFFNAVHPDTTISERATLGEGITVNAQSYLGPNVELCDHVLIDSCVNISHDVTVDKGATVAPGATIAGGVTVKRDAYIGPNATVLEDRTVGEHATVGAGAVVTDSVATDTTVVGVPAEPLER